MIFEISYMLPVVACFFVVNAITHQNYRPAAILNSLPHLHSAHSSIRSNHFSTRNLFRRPIRFIKGSPLPGYPAVRSYESGPDCGRTGRLRRLSYLTQRLGSQPPSDESPKWRRVTASNIEVAIQSPGRLSNYRNLTAAVYIPVPPSVVWEILTDYDRLEEVVPSLASNRVIDRWPGGARLLQIGEQRLLPAAPSALAGITGIMATASDSLTFRARCTLVCNEVPSSDPNNLPSRVVFNLVEGDFEEFTGTWTVTPMESGTGTLLQYNLGVRPGPFLPVSLVERRIASDIRSNLLALATVAVAKFQSQPQLQPQSIHPSSTTNNAQTPSLNPKTRRKNIKSESAIDLGLDLLTVDLAPPSLVPYLLSNTSLGRAVGTMPVPIPRFLLPLVGPGSGPGPESVSDSVSDSVSVSGSGYLAREPNQSVSWSKLPQEAIHALGIEWLAVNELFEAGPEFQPRPSDENIS
ncbi:hypothetical protein AAMO2058_001030000 [Amorphochlora amoebiformis]|mmetsp:Transcript_6307/g.9676  ORF Transcript_6307/g.9676 Transcript_6307/m.9676 type:complete len:465 (-) Transcript_6307:231-1625(-)